MDTFARDCFTGFDILSAEPGNYRFCIGDEHYISTLLAVRSLLSVKRGPKSIKHMSQFGMWQFQHLNNEISKPQSAYKGLPHVYCAEGIYFEVVESI